jgi:uncharacterized membrane protein HdeD (DUF308 family)
VLVRGVLAVIFGLSAWFAPASALLALLCVFGFYAITDGVAALVLLWTIGWFSLVLGIVYVVGAFRLRRAAGAATEL